MIWLSNYFLHSAIWLSKKYKPWFRFVLPILSRIADLPFHQMQITTMEQKERKGTHQKITNSTMEQKERKGTH
jgi:hypothetical protein